MTAHASGLLRATSRDYLALVKSHATPELLELARVVQANTDPLGFVLVNPNPTSGILVAQGFSSMISANDYRTSLLLRDVLQFWRERGGQVLGAIRELPFAVTINTDAIVTDVIRTHAAYFETVCVEDRLFSEASAEELDGAPMTPAALAEARTLQLSMLSLEPLLLADADPPLLVLYPDPMRLQRLLFPGAGMSAAFHSSVRARFEAFWQDVFQSVEPAHELAGRLVSREYCEAREPLSSNPVLRAMSEGDNIVHLANRYHIQSSIATSPTTSITVPPVHVGSALMGAVGAKLYQLQRWHYMSQLCSTDPLIDDLAWPLYKWSLDHDARVAALAVRIPEDVIAPRLLTLGEVRWLGKATIAELLALREVRGVDVIRSLIARHRKALKGSNCAGVDDAVRAAAADLSLALKDHEREVRAAKAGTTKRKRLNLAAFTVAGSLTIASAVLPGTALMLLSAVIGLGAGASVVNLIDEHVSGHRRIESLATRPLGILWRVRQRSPHAA